MVREKKLRQIERGAIFFADLDPVRGSEQGGQRPVVIIQNDVGNQHAPTVIVVPITAQIAKPKLPTHVALPAALPHTGIQRASVILCEQIRTIDKRRLQDQLGVVPAQVLTAVDQALVVSLDLV
ncbi:type II toxin-antitoxin system PemK/MazF family toxin [Weissella halotolerans]|uniref:mRNA interferase n=1 Tax=Weissella halotolerans DSM 20190 TaxID=1123500 RepID=A0A0R2FRZ1_9LACO|nr:type II toxin-antitoxin system PemK/MazF family toxin [Weissella halotolerans]KRN31241.1 toxin-antitoxin addiction module toxin component MazF (an endoRNAse) [Weissella halotolerans DSM 20190]